MQRSVPICAFERDPAKAAIGLCVAIACATACGGDEHAGNEPSESGGSSTTSDGGPAPSTGGQGGSVAAASGGAAGATSGGASSGGSVSDPCAGLSGRCVPICQGGQCDCHCDCLDDRDCNGRAPPDKCVPPGEPAPPCCGVGPQCGQGTPCPTTSTGVQMICTSGQCARCVPPCPDDAYCGEGYHCGADSLCAANRCDADGFVCPTRSTCDAGNPAADFHGCLRDACTSSSDCGGGACVNGRCYESAGRCVPTGCG